MQELPVAIEEVPSVLACVYVLTCKKIHPENHSHSLCVLRKRK